MAVPGPLWPTGPALPQPPAPGLRELLGAPLIKGTWGPPQQVGVQPGRGCNMEWFSRFGEGLTSNTKLHGLPSSGAYPLWNSPVPPHTHLCP